MDGGKFVLSRPCGAWVSAEEIKFSLQLVFVKVLCIEGVHKRLYYWLNSFTTGIAAFIPRRSMTFHVVVIVSRVVDAIVR